MPSENQHDWTPGPWVSLAGTTDEWIEVEGMDAIRVEGAFKCDGYPVTVAAVVDTDPVGWPGIGSVYANARLIALAPEMAEAILAMYEDVGRLAEDADLVHKLTSAERLCCDVARKLRALSRPEETR